MAGSPYYAPVLIGLGATELSMNVNAIARIREVISAISYSNAQTLASAVESAATSEEAESILMDHIHNNWPDLYPPRERS
jgi:phosphoenolpyruvate-protein kinase (PTS system EI component)